MYTIEIQDLSSRNEIVLETSLSPVQSINGMIGVVNISPSNIGLNNVNNTADIDKPVSNAVAAAIYNLEQKFISILPMQDVIFDVELPGAVDRFLVNYPDRLTKIPTSIYCYIKNSDGVAYENSVSDINLDNFSIEFSDFLSSDSYLLSVNLSFK